MLNLRKTGNQVRIEDLTLEKDSLKLDPACFPMMSPHGSPASQHLLQYRESLYRQEHGLARDPYSIP